MVIEEHNLDLAEAAMRDILFLFRDLILSYGGFGHGADRGQFDPFAFAQVEVREPEGVAFGIDTKLLITGSAVAVICAMSDTWDESDTVLSCAYFQRVEASLQVGGFAGFPGLREAMTLGLKDETAFRECLGRIYEAYVLGYFRQLIGAH